MRRGNNTTGLSHKSRPLCGYSQSLLIFALLSSTSAAPAAAPTTTTRSYNGQCFPENTAEGSVYGCADNPDYFTHRGLPCSFHAELISFSDGENCFHEWLAGVDTGATWLAKTYDQSQIFELIWECPCSCNIKCFDGDDDDDNSEEPTASPTSTPTMQDDGSAAAAAAASGAFHPVGGIGLPDKEFHGSGGSESVQTQSGDEKQTIESRLEDDEADKAVSTVVAPAVIDSSPDATDNSGSSTGFHLSESLQFVAMIAGTVVGVAVLYVSVFSLIQNIRKRSLGASAPIHHRDDLQLVSSLSDISDSIASDAESLNTEEKIRLYRAWKLAIINRRGIEDSFDVVEP